MTYGQFLALTHNTFPDDDDIRWGQHWFNTLYRVRPDIANQIRGTRFDPFYRDTVSTETSELCSQLWDAKSDR